MDAVGRVESLIHPFVIIVDVTGFAMNYTVYTISGRFMRIYSGFIVITIMGD